MDGIKLPVTATPSGVFIDAEGKWVQSDDVAAALNAAPTRAFEGLSDVELEDVLVQLTLAYNTGGVSTLRQSLQAFAAPEAQGGENG